jgi:hypothetical protein
LSCACAIGHACVYACDDLCADANASVANCCDFYACDDANDDDDARARAPANENN